MIASINNNLLISGVAGKQKDDLLGPRPVKRSGTLESGLVLDNASHSQQITELLELRNINDAISILQTAEYAVKALQNSLKSIHETIKQESSSGNTIDEHIKEKILELNNQVAKNINLIEYNELSRFIHEIPIKAYIGRGFFMDLKTNDLSFDFKKSLQEAEDAKAEIKRQQERLEKYREMLGIARNSFEAAMQSFKEFQIKGEQLQDTGSAEKTVSDIIEQIAKDCSMTSRSHSLVQADSVMKLTV